MNVTSRLASGRLWSLMAASTGNAAAGAKKALLIGCSYPGSDSALRGPGYDVSCMQALLASALGFPANSIRVLRDDSESSNSSSSSGMPSQAAILQELDWLVSGAAQGSNLFLFFSGHGYKARDPTGEEADRLDECILPTDWQQHDGSSGYIRDGQLAQLLLQRLPEGAVLHTLFDCCFSGTLMDLPYEARYNAEQQQSGWTRSSSMNGSHRSGSQAPTAGVRVVQLGACEEDQTAVTSRKLPGVVGTYTGAATHAFVTAIKEHGRQQSYASLLQHMTEALAALGKVSDEGLPEVLADEAAAAADDADGAADASKASDAVDAGSTVAGREATQHAGGTVKAVQVPVLCSDTEFDLDSHLVF
ncbi:hypothetical protein OEZ85_009523 [Tetradesmus obliquus]|uniref:Peptidase C14 caspase domain-containing protein n=1 Tax=Tetradesmus obliquus TaxID=3088 RepID=A0ABY8U9A1_TETOB|nr:hypothetical protein OEZ85_009523 [Tetradesmus obliquus]